MDILSNLAANKLFIGVAMIIMNLGSKHIVNDISPKLESAMKTSVFKMIIVFCIVFVATRDIKTALVLTFAFIVVVKGLLNEKTKYSIFHILKATSI
jgi:hypothetical protein